MAAPTHAITARKIQRCICFELASTTASAKAPVASQNRSMKTIIRAKSNIAAIENNI
jgi:hypothetical protein